MMRLFKEGKWSVNACHGTVEFVQESLIIGYSAKDNKGLCCMNVNIIRAFKENLKMDTITFDLI